MLGPLVDRAATIDADASLLGLPGYDGHSVVQSAAATGNLAFVETLLAPQYAPWVHVRARDPYGRHALEAAVRGGRDTIVQRLLRADPSLLWLPGYGNRSVLHTAARDGSETTLKLLKAAGRQAPI